LKQSKKILITILSVLSTLSITIYNSCKKDPCNGVSCSNGGVCVGGKCNCPSGYSGTSCQIQDPSTLIYQNNTYTPVNITINGTSSVIPVGGTVLYKGIPGGAATGSASTQGVTNSGLANGLTLTWSFSDVYPAANTSFTEYINVPANYYFLRIINNSNYFILQEYLDFNYSTLTAQTVDTITVYNERGEVNNFGYYSVDSSSNIYLTTTNPIINYYFPVPTLAFTQNQSFTFTAN